MAPLLHMCNNACDCVCMRTLSCVDATALSTTLSLVLVNSVNKVWIWRHSSWMGRNNNNRRLCYFIQMCPLPFSVEVGGLGGKHVDLSPPPSWRLELLDSMSLCLTEKRLLLPHTAWPACTSATSGGMFSDWLPAAPLRTLLPCFTELYASVHFTTGKTLECYCNVTNTSEAYCVLMVQ